MPAVKPVSGTKMVTSFLSPFYLSIITNPIERANIEKNLSTAYLLKQASNSTTNSYTQNFDTTLAARHDTDSSKKIGLYNRIKCL